MTSESVSERVLLTLVSGEPGAGKTTLIEAACAAEQRVEVVRVADAAAVAEGVSVALGRAPRRVLLEVSGDADPTAITASLYAAEELMRDVSIEPAICLLDTPRFLDQLAESGVRMVGQLRAAAVVLLNKVDACEQARASAVRREVEKLNPRAWIQECVRGRVPPAVLFMPATEGEDSGYSCFAWERADVLDRSRLEQLLKRLPRGLFRVKGVVRTPEGPYRLDYVTGNYDLEPAPAADPRPLVFVGRGIDKGRLLSLVDRCRAA